jgi:ketose-bisphosphate aldolase
MSVKAVMDRDGVRKLLRRARGEGFAVPAFNYSDIWDFLAIVEAAEELSAPVFISSHQSVAEAIGVEICGAIARAGALKAAVPLIHHLDHCRSVELCLAAVDNGYPSVMVDASMLPLEENIAAVTRVVQHAHARAAHVEAEVGRIKGAGFEGGYAGDDYLARVEDVVRLVSATQVDSLAVGIGTAHGFYEGKPEIRFDRLAAIAAAVDIPLVLHGGTGIPEEDVRRAISGGIAKVNVGTIIHCTYMNTVRAELSRRGDNAYTLDVMKPARAAVREVVKGWIRSCRADGRA